MSSAHLRRLLALLASALCAYLPAAADIRVELQVDLGEDQGQNYGTLFEAHDADGKILAGAGFLGSYNTQARSDRRLLHFFVKQPSAKFVPEPLPRVNDDAGMYLFEFDRQLFARGRSGGKDNRLFVWRPEAQQWRVDETTVSFSVQVGNGVLSASPQEIVYDGKSILKVPEEGGALTETYYAAGTLVCRVYDQSAIPPVNELLAVGWRPGTPPGLPGASAVLPLRTPTEFVYAYGQLGEEIVAATNTGGVYVWGAGAWRVIREPEPGVSFQIYAMLNYKDALLMGQYPTGEIFRYDGREMKHLPGWPPVMPGVSSNAREAQSLTIYGGDLYAGVWPWGEVWRMDSSTGHWEFLGRMFSHPEVTTATTHPYENETKALDEVLNRWGQRVTSLVPFEKSLFISTSAKTGAPYEPKFSFLDQGKWEDYGRIYRHAQPGALAVSLPPMEGPFRMDFRVSKGVMSVTLEGKGLGESSISETCLEGFKGDMTWGTGVFGVFQGKFCPGRLAVEH